MTCPNYSNLTCTLCGRVYNYYTYAGHTLDKCNSCVVNERRFALKRQYVDYKGGKCSKCGYDKCLKAMHFHHLDSSKKDFTISGSHTRAWHVIKEELDKCALLCANCHAETHDGL